MDAPTYSRRLHRLFALYLRRYFARHFDAVRVSRNGGVPSTGDGPLIVYANHPSWWDPVLLLLLGAELFPDRPGYGPMDAAQLERYGIFRWLGVFGVEPGTVRGARAFLRQASAALERPGATLWLTAEGRFTDPRRRPVRLRPGLGHLVRRMRGVTVVPLAIEYPFWDERLPEALVRFGPPLRVDDGTRHRPLEWSRIFERRLEETMDALAIDAQARAPERFHRLLAGRAGVGGVYDRWRRLQAALTGGGFRASHGER